MHAVLAGSQYQWRNMGFKPGHQEMGYRSAVAGRIAVIESWNQLAGTDSHKMHHHIAYRRFLKRFPTFCRRVET